MMSTTLLTGNDVRRLGIILAANQQWFSIDTGQLYIGDGRTLGGINMKTKRATGSPSTPVAIPVKTGQESSAAASVPVTNPLIIPRASRAEAEAGHDNFKVMTPLRVREALESAVLDGGLA